MDSGAGAGLRRSSRASGCGEERRKGQPLPVFRRAARLRPLGRRAPLRYLRAKDGRVERLRPQDGRRYFYYTCSRLRNSDSAGCETKIRSVRADVLEPRIWEFVSGLILEPGRLRRGLDAMIEEEERARRGDPDR